MNVGAARATGDWLLFLHADSRLPDDGLARILALDASVSAGGFLQRFSGDDWRLRVVSWLDNLRCHRTGIVYGDQALFVRRSVFLELGGFPEVRTLEDVLFSETLKRNGMRPVILDQEVVTDSRKFEQMGVWRGLARCVVIQVSPQAWPSACSGRAVFSGSAMSRTLKPLTNLLRQRPVLAVLEVTLRCNSACGYCDLPLNQGRYELTRNELREVGQQLYEEGVRFLLVQGGEPLVRKDLLEILTDLSAIGFGITLVTNGTRLKPNLVATMSELGVSISVSLDSLDRDRYRRIRGADQLPLVLAGLERLRDYPHRKFITCIVSELNRDDVEDVVRFANAGGFTPVVGAYHWDVDRYGKEDEQLKYKNEHASAVFERLLAQDLVPKGYFRQYLRDNVTWLSGRRLPDCDAGTYSIAVDASGNVCALSCAAACRQPSL